MEPLVTIMLVTYNRLPELQRALKSAYEQSYQHVEIVVIDNASQDGTADWVEQHHPDIRLLRLYRNIGCPSARNTGFAMSAGTYVYSLDDDGWLDRDAVKRAVALMEQDESVAVVMSTLIEIETGASKVPLVVPSGETKEILLFTGGCVAIRREALGQVGGYPEDFFRQAEELELALRFFSAGWRMLHEPHSVMYHQPSMVGRDQKTFIYYQLRNTNKTAIRLWPLRYMVLMLLRNICHAISFGVALAYPALLPGIVREMVRDLILIFPTTRHPVSAGIFRAYRQALLESGAHVGGSHGR
jgi:GT2 family glycosyltransferase